MNMKKTSAKISDHFAGLGTVTRDMVEKRAREIAMINGRAPDKFTQTDFWEAKQELTGAVVDSTAREEEAIETTTGRDGNPGTTAHQTPTRSARDEQTVAEELVQQGLEEAEHEQMVASAKNSESDATE